MTMSKQLHDLCLLPTLHNEKAPNLDKQFPDQKKVSWGKSGRESVDNQYMGRE